MKLNFIKQKISKEKLYRFAFKEACDMLVRTNWYKTIESAQESILIKIRKQYDIS